MNLGDVRSASGLELELEGLVVKHGLDVLGSSGSRTGHCEVCVGWMKRLGWYDGEVVGVSLSLEE